MLTFEWPYMAFAVLLPLLVILSLPRANTAHSAALKVPFFSALSATKGHLPLRHMWRSLITCFTWVLLVMACCRPQWQGAPIITQQAGRAIFLVLDLSGSMQLPDMVDKNHRINRLQAVKKVATQFIQQRTGDQLGLILFGSRAYLQTPLTFDRHTVATQLADATVGLAGQRTAMGDGITLAMRELSKQPKNARVMILLTDGANNAGRIAPLDTLEYAIKLGIRIYTVGIGGKETMFTDPLGNHYAMPTSDLDVKTLKTIADKTGGLFFRASDAQGLQDAYQKISRLEPRATKNIVAQPKQSLLMWPLGLALLLSYLLVATRRKI
ncbi:MAG: hypothetical protein DHS20C10_02880 [marine bacterium B5-7]|nr:MAG: hypothetical protein DHS20C10_02880 [marine bacterium B5-7]